MGRRAAPVRARRGRAPTRCFLRFALVLIGVRVLFSGSCSASPSATTCCSRCRRCRCPTGRPGSARRRRSPPSSCSQSLYDGLQLATILVCIGAANSLASPSRLLKSVPAALYEVGVAVVVAMTFAPQLVADVARVRRGAPAARPAAHRSARRSPARSARAGGRAGTLAVALAAAMDSRGYGRTAGLPRRASRHVTSVAARSAASRGLRRRVRAARRGHAPAALGAAAARSAASSPAVGGPGWRAAAACARATVPTRGARPSGWSRRSGAGAGGGRSSRLGRGPGDARRTVRAAGLAGAAAPRRALAVLVALAARRRAALPPGATGASRPRPARPRAGERGRMIRFEQVSVHYAGAAQPDPARRRPARPRGRAVPRRRPHRVGQVDAAAARSTGSCRTSPAAPCPAGSPSTAATPATHPPRELADVVGVVGQDPMRRLRDRHGRGRARVRHGVARPAARRDAPPRRGDPRPARPRRAARPPAADAVRRPAAAGRDRLGARPRTRGSWCSTSPPPRSIPVAAEEVLAALQRLVHDLGLTVVHGRAPARAGRAVRRPRRRCCPAAAAAVASATAGACMRDVPGRAAGRRARPAGRLDPAAAVGTRRPPRRRAAARAARRGRAARAVATTRRTAAPARRGPARPARRARTARSRALRGVDLRVARRRGRRADGAQRRRQVHAARAPRSGCVAPSQRQRPRRRRRPLGAARPVT